MNSLTSKFALVIHIAVSEKPARAGRVNPFQPILIEHLCEKYSDGPVYKCERMCVGECSKEILEKSTF